MDDDGNHLFSFEDEPWSNSRSHPYDRRILNTIKKLIAGLPCMISYQGHVVLNWKRPRIVKWLEDSPVHEDECKAFLFAKVKKLPKILLWLQEQVTESQATGTSKQQGTVPYLCVIMRLADEHEVGITKLVENFQNRPSLSTSTILPRCFLKHLYFPIRRSSTRWATTTGAFAAMQKKDGWTLTSDEFIGRGLCLCTIGVRQHQSIPNFDSWIWWIWFGVHRTLHQIPLNLQKLNPKINWLCALRNFDSLISKTKKKLTRQALRDPKKLMSLFNRRSQEEKNEDIQTWRYAFGIQTAILGWQVRTNVSTPARAQIQVLVNWHRSEHDFRWNDFDEPDFC